MNVNYDLLYSVLEVLLGCRLVYDLLFVWSRAAEEAAGIALFCLGIDDHLLGGEGKLTGAENAYLNTVPFVMTPLIQEVVNVLPLDSLGNNWHDIVFRWQFVEWIFISSYLFLRQVNPIDHWHKDDLVTCNILQSLFVDLLHEWAPVAHT